METTMIFSTEICKEIEKLKKDISKLDERVTILEAACKELDRLMSKSDPCNELDEAGFNVL